MSGTALYRALVAAGAPEDLAGEAAREISDIRAVLVEVRTTVRILAGLNIGFLFLILGLYFRG